MVTTALIGGVVSSHFDSELVKELKIQVVKIYAMREQSLLIGIRNQDGDIYRAVGANSTGEFFSVLKNLSQFDLFNEQGAMSISGGRYQAILIYKGPVTALSKSRFKVLVPIPMVL
ncbi:hypothetical protein PQR62_04010 [Herbaspirillum lusitanum]|jgi:hypothetical protein|uniref:Uncharacterized protein n=1 Tax=Herbaspirillum lusitanum TaxID=213312 RepID=A0ABW9A4P3_9BURK